MYILALAFVNNAFKNNLTSPKAIYKLVVPLEIDCIYLL